MKLLREKQFFTDSGRDKSIHNQNAQEADKMFPVMKKCIQYVEEKKHRPKCNYSTHYCNFLIYTFIHKYYIFYLPQIQISQKDKPIGILFLSRIVLNKQHTVYYNSPEVLQDVINLF